MPINERHDTGELYNKLSVGELQRLVPEIDWLEYFNEFMPMNVSDNERVVCFALDYVKQLGPLVNQTESRCVRARFSYTVKLCMKLRCLLSSCHYDATNTNHDTMRNMNTCINMTKSNVILATSHQIARSNSNVIGHVSSTRVIANYLMWRLVMGLAPELPQAFQEVRNNYRKVLYVGTFLAHCCA